MIYINDIPSLRDADSDDGLIIDDRKEIIDLINGTVIQNGGIFFGGFKITCVFSKNNFARFLNLWLSNTTVSYTDKTGVTFSGLTIKLYNVIPVDQFTHYVSVKFDLIKAQNRQLAISDFGI